MEDKLPPWLDATFLAAALQGGEAQEPRVTVTKFSATLAVAPGNNYLSRLFRVKVDYTVKEEEKSCSLIVKVPFTTGVINEMGDEFDLYGKEYNVYGHLLPVLNRTVNSEIGPQSFHSSVKKVLVLSDLKEQGYEMCDRYKQLDFYHCEQVFKTVAKLHAASVVCKRDHPDLIELARKEIFCNEGEQFESQMKPWIQQSMKTVIGIVEEMNLGKDVKDYILNKIETAPESIVRLCKPRTTGLNVLNHGDFWMNNILFKHTSSGEIVDVKLVDFQIMRYTSPVMDLTYFIWTSANEEVRESRLPELFEIYRVTLNSTLERLGCEERLTEVEVHECLRETVDWGLVTICNVLPVVTSDPGNVINVEDVNQEDMKSGQHEDFTKLFKGKHYRALLPKLLEQLMAFESAWK